MGFFHSRDTANLIQVTAPGHDGIRASVAYDRILIYYQAARRQQQRIARLIQKNNRSISRLARRKTFNQVFTEIHFYFITWNTILEMFKVLSGSSHLSCIKPLLSRHKNLLEHYGGGRNVLEHYRDRLPGGKRVHTMSAPYDIGNLHGTNFTFGGKKWDVGPNSIKLLKALVKQLEQEARREVNKKYQALRSK